MNELLTRPNFNELDGYKSRESYEAKHGGKVSRIVPNIMVSILPKSVYGQYLV